MGITDEVILSIKSHSIICKHPYLEILIILYLEFVLSYYCTYIDSVPFASHFRFYRSWYHQKYGKLSQPRAI